MSFLLSATNFKLARWQRMNGKVGFPEGETSETNEGHSFSLLLRSLRYSGRNLMIDLNNRLLRDVLDHESSRKRALKKNWAGSPDKKKSVQGGLGSRGSGDRQLCDTCDVGVAYVNLFSSETWQLLVITPCDVTYSPVAGRIAPNLSDKCVFHNLWQNQIWKTRNTMIRKIICD